MKTMGLKLAAITAVSTLSLGMPAVAQTQPGAVACELHIWPAERMTATTTGWLSGLGALGAVADVAGHAKGNTDRRTQLASALDSPTQLDLLQSIDLQKELALSPGTMIVRHEEPLDRKTMNSAKTRRSDSTANCYSELIVADVAYQKAAIYGRSLKTLFMVRDFGDDQTIDREYKAWGGNGLKLFPPKEGEDALPAIDELQTVFKANFTEYAANARRNRGATAAR